MRAGPARRWPKKDFVICREESSGNYFKANVAQIVNLRIDNPELGSVLICRWRDGVSTGSGSDRASLLPIGRVQTMNRQLEIGNGVTRSLPPGTDLILKLRHYPELRY